MTTVLEVRDIQKSFGKTEVLRGVSFSIERGEIFGFLGRNGAGKSTLIHILTGVKYPTSGSFQILGLPIEEAKRHIGVFPDIDQFYNEWTAMQHLTFFAKLQKIPCSKAELEALLRQVGLQNEMKKKVKQYSFGMKKKLGVAQALIGQPDFIILDEPTSGLDPESAIHMRQLIHQMAANCQTVFVTSHNLNELEKMSDRIAILKEGHISNIGTMEQLRNVSNYAIEIHITLDRTPEEAFLQTLTTRYEVNDTNVTLFLQQKEDVAECIRALVFANYAIYKVTQKEQTLEEIFLQTES